MARLIECLQGTGLQLASADLSVTLSAQEGCQCHQQGHLATSHPWSAEVSVAA